MSQPDDILEQEADEVAELVLGMYSSTGSERILSGSTTVGNSNCTGC
jgi:hypothetical protein